MLCAHGHTCSSPCVLSCHGLGLDCEQLWVSTGQALLNQLAGNSPVMAARLVWEQSFSGWLARDSYGTGKSRAQVRLRKFQELTPSSQLLPGGGRVGVWRTQTAVFTG